MASVKELEGRQDEIRRRIKEIDKEHEGEMLPDEARGEWNALNEELETNAKQVKELNARSARVEALFGEGGDGNVEREPVFEGGVQRRKPSRVPSDPTRIEEYRSLSSGMSELNGAYRDGAKKIIAERFSPAHPSANREDSQEHLDRLLDTIDANDDRLLARRIIVTSSPLYKRAFAKAVAAGKTDGLNPEEQRALALGAQGGNYPVPIDLDPTVILTSNGVVNPMRMISRVIQTTRNTYEGVLSAGITATYAAESAEASDDSPTLTQPTWNVEKAHAFVPFTMENAEDWPELQAEMARLIQDGKDTLEADKFLTGAGHGSQVPQGLLVGATAVVNTAATTTFAVGDVYALEEALAPRWRPRATIVMNKKYANKIRQFDTAGGASLWVQLGDGTPPRLLAYPTFEYSNYSTAATSGASIVTIGDFTQFVIIDRIGMDVELVPHLFATANNRPSGQRGIYAHWRNTAGVTTQLAFKTLKLL